MTATTTAVTVRDYTDADKGALRELFYEVARDVYRVKASDAALRKASELLESHLRHRRHFVAEVDGVVIGFSSAFKPLSDSQVRAYFAALTNEGRLMSGSMRPTMWRALHASLSIYVRPAWRKGSVGPRLLREAARYLMDSGARTVRVVAANAELRELCERRGGRVVEKRSDGTVYELDLEPWAGRDHAGGPT